MEKKFLTRSSHNDYLPSEGADRKLKPFEPDATQTFAEQCMQLRFEMHKMAPE